MAAKLITLLHDDWEIRGNGLGNVAHLQYIPALALMRIAKESGVALTFMAELGQQLTFLRYAECDRNLALQAQIWEECTRLMVENGFDVQPHIHPHWFKSSYHDGYIHVGRNWNLGTYDNDERKSILRECFAYLVRVVRKVDSNYAINTFKAGSHALQPSRGFLADLKDEGVKMVLGPRSGMKILNAEFSLDYRTLEEDTFPYYPYFEDVNALGEDNGLVVIPLTYWDVDLKGKAYTILRRISQLLSRQSLTTRFPYHSKIPKSIQDLNPRVDRSESAIIRKLLKPFRTGLNLAGPQSFAEMKHCLDAMVNRLLLLDAEAVPLVIESHSKDHDGNWDTIARFLNYMTERYGSDMEFMTFSQFAEYLATQPSMIRGKIP